jgi:hypothetical protein
MKLTFCERLYPNALFSAEAAAVGKAVFELEPDSAAAKEIGILINEIMEQ